MKRLKTRGIVSLQPKRIMISGKVRVYAFDKTGTLTKDGLDFLGFQPVVGGGSGGGEAGKPVRLATALSPADGLAAADLPGLATCHTAEKCGDMVIANEVEVRGRVWE
jgi:magnesium-transporting ATPase (P-type)